MAEPRSRGTNVAPDHRAMVVSNDGRAPGAVPDPCRPAAAMTVLYDGACPLCRREIGLYRSLPATQPLAFEDVSDPTAALPDGHTRDALLARFHVRLGSGSVLSGAQAFLAMWAVLPGWRWLARAGRMPGAAWLLERGYRGFLKLRPWLQRGVARFDAARTGNASRR